MSDKYTYSNTIAILAVLGITNFYLSGRFYWRVFSVIMAIAFAIFLFEKSKKKKEKKDAN